MNQRLVFGVDDFLAQGEDGVENHIDMALLEIVEL